MSVNKIKIFHFAWLGGRLPSATFTMSRASLSVRNSAALLTLLVWPCSGYTGPGSSPSLQRTFAHRLSEDGQWSRLKNQLDNSVPVFVVTDEESRPLEYEKGGSPILVCFAGAEGALAERERSAQKFPLLRLRIQPVGLGAAMERVQEGRAVLVPSAYDVKVARASNPDGEDWDGGALPLFGCHSMKRRRKDGEVATPLFLSVEEAKEALADADPKREVKS